MVFSVKGRSTGRRPAIGISSDLSLPPVQPPRIELKTSYCEAVLKAGGLPMVLPVVEDPTCVEAYLERLNGLVITGGAFDIPPEMYGETPREGLGTLKPLRSAFERALISAALQKNIPILGVCGGMQLLHAVLGGTLVQDIRREFPGAREHEQGHDRSQPQHPVEVKEGTLLAEIVGKGQLMVNSTHHQAAKKLENPKITISAVAPDGVVEAIESTQHPFAIGVQWHPESMIQTLPIHLSLYKGLVNHAKR